jgi:hypothetical protein
MAAPRIVSRQIARPPSVQPASKAIPIGMGLSGASKYRPIRDSMQACPVNSRGRLDSREERPGSPPGAAPFQATPPGPGCRPDPRSAPPSCHDWQHGPPGPGRRPRRGPPPTARTRGRRAPLSSRIGRSWHQRWGELANALQDQGIPWPEHEREAVRHVKVEMIASIA